MIITCDKCNTRFDLDESLVEETGSKVRCTNCDNVFVAYPPKQSEETEPELVLDLEIDPEGKEKVTEAKTPVEETDSLDLSDLEEMLEVEDIEEPGGDAKGEAAEPELELELEVASEDDPVAVESEDQAGDSDALDLSDIEKLLEMEDIEEPEEDDEAEEAELTLELDMDSEAEAVEEPAEVTPGEEDLDLDLDLELELESDEDLQLELDESEELDLELDEDEETLEASDAAEPSEAEDVDLDFGSEEAEKEAVTAEETVSGPVEEEKEEAEAAAFGMGAEEEAKEAKVVVAAFKPSFPIPKRRMGAPVFILIFLLILAGGAFGTYFYMNQKGIKLPFVAKHGEIVPLEESFKYKFIDNARVGSLFVITGFVLNKYDHGRSHIQVNGELLTEGENVIQTQTVFGGNIISELELSNSDMSNIKIRLGNKSGDKQSNVNLKSGAKLPFMIVFSNLPENISEYRIQVAGSSPAGK